MKKQTLLLTIAGGVAIAGVMTYFIVHNINDQSNTQRQLDDLKKQLAAATQSAVAPAGTGPALVIGNTTQGGTLAQEKAIADVINEGQRLLDAGTPEKVQTAARIFQEAIDKLDARNPDLYSGLGKARLMTRQYPEATQAYHRAIELSPQRVDLWVGIATAYWGLKDFYHAKIAYDQAIALNPNSVEAWSVMAWVYLSLKDVTTAQKGFRVLVDSGSDRLDWKTGLTMARAGNTQADQIRGQFPALPDPALFLTPPASMPATLPAPSK